LANDGPGAPAASAVREERETTPMALMDTMPAAEPTLTPEAHGDAKTRAMLPPPHQAMPVTPVVPFHEPVPPPRPSAGLMDLSIDLGTPADADFGAGLAEAWLPVGTPGEPQAAPFDATRPPTDPINEAFAESFGVLYDESGMEAAPPPSTPDAEAAQEEAHHFSFDATPISFADSMPGAEGATSPFADIAVGSSTDLGEEFLAGPGAEPVNSPVETSAPADATADYLFGDAVSDVLPVPADVDTGDSVPTSLPPTDSPGADVVAVEAIVETPQAFVTETMAELYLQQGFRDEALHVYRLLSAQNPDDENLRERVRHLEHGHGASLSPNAAGAAAPAATEPLASAPEGSAPIGAMLEPATAAQGARATVTPTSGTPLATARSFFASLSLRRALRADGTPPIGMDAVEEAPAPTAVAAHSFAAGGALDTLFGQPVSDDEEYLAVSIASMAEGIEVPSPVVKGQPTKPAETEFSLDNVFRENTPRAGAVVSRRSQKLRFDQFFTPSDDTGAVEAPPPAGEPGSPADLEQFSSWLQGLKPK
jgi:hypothetical protein